MGGGGARPARYMGAGVGWRGDVVGGQQARPIPARRVVRGVAPRVVRPVSRVTPVSWRGVGASKGAAVPRRALVSPVPPGWVVPPGRVVRLGRPAGHLDGGVTFVRHCQAVNTKT